MVARGREQLLASVRCAHLEAASCGCCARRWVRSEPLLTSRGSGMDGAGGGRGVAVHCLGVSLFGLLTRLAHYPPSVTKGLSPDSAAPGSRVPPWLPTPWHGQRVSAPSLHPGDSLPRGPSQDEGQQLSPGHRWGDCAPASWRARSPKAGVMPCVPLRPLGLGHSPTEHRDCRI